MSTVKYESPGAVICVYSRAADAAALKIMRLWALVPHGYRHGGHDSLAHLAY
jgi:hypothetical protein